MLWDAAGDKVLCSWNLLHSESQGIPSKYMTLTTHNARQASGWMLSTARPLNCCLGRAVLLPSFKLISHIFSAWELGHGGLVPVSH